MGFYICYRLHDGGCNMKSDPHPKEWAELGSFKSYLLGFLLSVLLTLGMYFSATQKVFSKGGLLFIIVGLALVQMFVQFVFFLHLGKESKPRWGVMVFLFMLLIVVVLVFGSLWIMNNLDYRMMTPMDMEHMQQHEGI